MKMLQAHSVSRHACATLLQRAWRSRLCHSVFGGNVGSCMRARNVQIPVEDRVDELLAIINMIGYAIGVAGDIGVKDGISDLESARMKLVLELQQISFGDLSLDEMSRLARAQPGHC
jgi:hypothetical protein